ncbi:MAG: SCO family protein [Sphingomonas sp.]|nr:SCO family protein [Sphingomonas sp.]
MAVLLLRQPVSETAPVSPASLGGPFTLTGADGGTFSSTALAGRPYAIFFGFTHCPDVCPTTLARMVRLRRELRAGSEPFKILFVSVDPERDGPAELRNYLSLFPEPIIGLTGTPARIDHAKRQFGIFSQKVPDESGGYTVDHSAAVLLFDRSGKFVATISAEENDTVALQKLKRIAPST